MSAILFRPSRFHGEQMEGEEDTYYVALKSSTSAISGFVSHAEFDWLAERLGTPKLPEVSRG